MSASFVSKLKPVIISGKEVLPIIEGGKGISATNGKSAGAFAAAGAVGTFSGVNADSFDEAGRRIAQIYHGKTRKERHEELVAYGIAGGLTQARMAHEISGGHGRIHVNVLWEMGGAERILIGILEGAKGLVHGVTCGAGMPYRLAEIAARYQVYYHPIVSSMRAFRALWKRSYHKTPQWLGSVVYEDPWLAGGHNGLSNGENPLHPEDPYPRVAELRQCMNALGLQDIPIVMAGGVWRLREWEHWLDNPEIGKIAFQFGTRPLLTQESPIPIEWKNKLLTLKEGDVFLNHFSPTGFYSSAVNNAFLQAMQARVERQVAYRTQADDEFSADFPLGARGRPVYLKSEDKVKSAAFVQHGFSEALKTPDGTLVFVTPENASEILTDQIDCMGCLSHCRFSNWKDHDEYTTGKKTDPRSFCIQKSLQKIVHEGDTEHSLMFSGHNAYRFAQDPLYTDGYIPTVKELVERIMVGE